MIEISLEEFTLKVTKAFEAYVGAGAHVMIQKVKKNNGIVLTGLSVFGNGKNISPTIYLEEFYRRYCSGETFARVMEEFIRCYESHLCEKNIDMSFYMEYEKVRSYLGLKIVNYEKNKELLKEVPHKQYLNLAILFYCAVENQEIGNGIILVKENHLKIWNVNMETVYEDAMKNAVWKYPVKVYPLPELLKEFPEALDWQEMAEEGTGSMDGMGEADCFEGCPMYVLTNKQKVFGAAVLLYKDVLKKVAKRLHSNLVILPSSVHEVIAVPVQNMAEAAGYESMVREINETQLEAEDVLSDQVYYYERQSGSLTIAQTSRTSAVS